eukprot:GAHX01002611.1.p2 GENE.GAHX01002611.1~~GAHX01002611.1.p2  ORF type:complete len:418 (-),score=65.96 GAHX01002611.1:1872-3092(-)
MDIEQIDNLGKYDDIYCANALNDEDSYILAMSEDCIDVYNKSPKPTLLFQDKCHQQSQYTAFFEYNEKEQSIPFISLLNSHLGQVVFGAYKISDSQLEYYQIDDNIHIEDFVGYRICSHHVQIHDNVLLVVIGKSLVCVKCLTHSLRLQISSLLLLEKHLLSTFPTPDKDKLILLTYSEYKIPYNRKLTNKVEKSYNRYTFLVLDKLKLAYCSFEIENLNIKEKSLTCFLQSEKLIKVIQDPSHWHRFVLLSRKHMYKIDFKEIKKEADNIIITNENISVNKKNRTDIKYGPINKTELARKIERRLKGEFIPHLINIDSQNFMLFFWEGFVMNYKLNENMFLTLYEFDQDNDSVLRVVELYRDKDIILVWMEYTCCGNTIFKINRSFENNNNLDILEVMSVPYLPS